jgi:hypothetical protein
MPKERWYKEPKPLPYGYRPVVTTNLNLSEMGNLRKNLHEWIHSSDDRQQKITINARREMQIYIDVTEDHSDELGPYR